MKEVRMKRLCLWEEEACAWGRCMHVPRSKKCVSRFVRSSSGRELGEGVREGESALLEEEAHSRSCSERGGGNG